MIFDRNLLIIDGPSAVGKTTVVDLLLTNRNPSFVIAKRVTTREKRNTGEDELSYDYVSKADFDNMIKRNELVEYHNYLFGMSYGLPKENILTLLEQGKNVIGMINLGNIKAVRKVFPNCFGVFIKASPHTIEKRLRMRNLHNDKQIKERLKNAQKASMYEEWYDLVITNEDISPEETVARISNAFLTYQKIGAHGK